jgi:hypothetical protein
MQTITADTRESVNEWHRTSARARGQHLLTGHDGLHSRKG